MDLSNLTSFSLAQLTHLHLLLNHFPTIGSIMGLGLLLFAIVRKHDDLIRFSFGVFLVIAVLALPLYMTGKAAQEAIAGRPEVAEALIATHQDAALLTFFFMIVTGAFAWLGLWQFRRVSRLAPWNLYTVLILAIVTFGLTARVANIGGEIRHAEIRVEETSATPATSGEFLNSEGIATYISNASWAWPAMETLHFIGLSLLFGVVLAVNLRLLGVGKNVPYSALHRLLPWGILGFGINLVTGMLFFISVPGQYTQNVALHWKTILMMIGGINVLYFTVFEQAWALGPGDDAPLTGKLVAASTIFVWFGVILMGRMMPFIGGSF